MALGKVWPRAGCIGQTRFDEEYARYSACVYMIEEGIRRGGIPPLGEWSDGLGHSTVYCGQPVASVRQPSPGRAR